MSLADLRAQFVSESGREDLSNPAIDRFINNGVRLLDRLSNFEKAPAVQRIILPANGKVVAFSSECRLIGSVFCIDSVDGRSPVTRKSYYEILSLDTPDSTPGIPLYYAPSVLRAFPDSFDETDAAFVPYAAFIDANTAYQSYRGIHLSPLTDEEYLIEILGKFYSPTLVSGGVAPVLDNWWSINNQQAIINAALYELQRSYKNTEGMNWAMSAIKETLIGLDYDDAEEESNDASVMEG